MADLPKIFKKDVSNRGEAGKLHLLGGVFVNMKELRLEIERSRAEMNQIAEHHSLLSGKMLAKSRRLDSLLNQYQKKNRQLEQGTLCGHEEDAIFLF